MYPRGLVLSFLALLVGALIAPTVHAGEVLDRVKSRGRLTCGVSGDVAGFAEKDAGGQWRGLDADFCRAVAAAVIGRAEAVKFRPLKASKRFPALNADRVDLLVRNTTWTLGRETLLGVRFAGILFFDGQGFLVKASDGITSLAGLNGQTVCVEKATRHAERLQEHFAAHGWTVTPLVIDSYAEVTQAFFSGKCRAYTSDASQLAATRQRAPAGGEAYTILPERISKEPLGPAVPARDPEWATVVRLVLNALIAAEEAGVSGAGSAGTEPPAVAIRYLPPETDAQIARALGIPPGWMRRAIGAGGNYGEIYERNFGRAGGVTIERGPNRLWTQGGLHYALPFD